MIDIYQELIYMIDNSIIKKGTKICMIKINKISELTSYLELTKQMYKCKMFEGYMFRL